LVATYKIETQRGSFLVVEELCVFWLDLKIYGVDRLGKTCIISILKRKEKGRVVVGVLYKVGISCIVYSWRMYCIFRF